jgi:hypothetical protein
MIFAVVVVKSRGWVVEGGGRLTGETEYRSKAQAAATKIRQLKNHKFSSTAASFFCAIKLGSHSKHKGILIPYAEHLHPNNSISLWGLSDEVGV